MEARRVADIDWTNWTAVDPATLVFVIRNGKALLIRKKRGLGAGKINAPGGRLESGETPDACAVREVREELGVTPLGLVKLGEHRFQFVDGYSIYVHVYRASDLRGVPVETDEAVPIWVGLDEIPFDRTVKIVKCRGAATQEEFTKNTDLRIGELDVRWLDKVDPRVFPQLGVGQFKDHRFLYLYRGHSRHPAREILFGDWTIDDPRVTPVGLSELLQATRVRAVSDTDERPLETDEAVVT